MSREAELIEQIDRLRSKLTALNEASARINQGRDYDTVLQEVLESARTLTGARYGVIAARDGAGEIETVFSAGITADEHEQMLSRPEVITILNHFSGIAAALRMADYQAYAVEQGLGGQIPIPVGAAMAAPIGQQQETVGTLYLGREREDEPFSEEDEETLVAFAVQAAAVMSNMRRYRDEQDARSELEALIDTSPIGVVVFDGLNGAPTIFNREAARMWGPMLDPGQRPEDLFELLTVSQLDGSQVSLSEHTASELLAMGETLRAQELHFEVPDGRSLTALTNATPIFTEQGELKRYIVTIQDMAPIQEQERLRAEFLATVSHELRSPLASVKGSVTNLLDPTTRLDPAEVSQFLRIIESQTDRMRQLVRDLLDVARIETGSLSTAPESSRVERLIEEARTAFQGSGAGQRLVIEIPPKLPSVMADRQRLVQVLINLLNNAARSSSNDSTIRITAATDDVHVTVSVSDEGRGIPADRLPRLFRKFSRIEAEDQGGDTGLGLAISKGIVEAQGGRIWAESSGPGQGARFSFTVPVAAASPRRRRPRRARAAAPPGDQVDPGLARILAVDDDPEALRYIRDALANAGYAPVLTADPNEVLPLLAEEQPALVLLDLVLPGRDGLQLMKEIHERRRVPVIFLSAYGQEDTIAKAFDQGADDYIVKPFAPTELAARIRAALRRRELREPHEPYVHGGLIIDYARRLVTVDQRPVELTSIEYRLLVDLSAHSGGAVSFADLLQRVWGVEEGEDRRALRTVVKSLRRKLGDDANHPRYVFTENRVGYRMPEPAAAAPDGRSAD